MTPRTAVRLVAWAIVAALVGTAFGMGHALGWTLVSRALASRLWDNENAGTSSEPDTVSTDALCASPAEGVTVLGGLDHAAEDDGREVLESGRSFGWSRCMLAHLSAVSPRLWRCGDGRCPDGTPHRLDAGAWANPTGMSHSASLRQPTVLQPSASCGWDTSRQHAGQTNSRTGMDVRSLRTTQWPRTSDSRTGGRDQTPLCSGRGFALQLVQSLRDFQTDCVGNPRRADMEKSSLADLLSRRLRFPGPPSDSDLPHPSGSLTDGTPSSGVARRTEGPTPPNADAPDRGPGVAGGPSPLSTRDAARTVGEGSPRTAPILRGIASHYGAGWDGWLEL